MARLNFREIEPASGKSNDLDQFEKFAKIFLESVIGGKITKGPTRGADGGIDLRLEIEEHGTTVKKLVSCKHYANSKESVGVNDEIDIRDRLESFGCTVFVGFYSTIASTGLEQKLERLQKEKGIRSELYNSEDMALFRLNVDDLLAES
ncbi:restriction endonuclease [Cupriavidus sp. YAF13]|uniref:restriction endonuclease n=1 Tax=Cupriavidus sp. YAF13 TaxID=3233075 RepID=UPI003F8F5658